MQAEDDRMVGRRFRMLESMRDLALGQPVHVEEYGRLRHAHAEYFLELAERAAPKLVSRA